MRKNTLFVVFVIVMVFLLMAAAPTSAHAHENGNDLPSGTLTINGSVLTYEGHGYLQIDYNVAFCDNTGTGFVPFEHAQKSWSHDFGKRIMFADVWVITEEHIDWWENYDKSQWPGHGQFGIVVHADEQACPQEASNDMKPLVDLWVYYSESGFYVNDAGGLVNTCTIFIHPDLSTGGINDETIARLCHQVPDDKVIGCQEPLYDDGNHGYTACDDFLKSVGERRASLRNDIQGPEMDLLPKIERYFSILRALGKID